MIAIVDSGSTKSSWTFVDQDSTKYEFKTVGFNPYYVSSEEIFNILSKDLLPNLPQAKIVTEIYFYGAGCERISQREIIANGLKKVFPQAIIQIDHDLLAAARSLFGNQPGIACIAGTGANTCYYDGQNIIENVYSPGLALADEGSGGYLGKTLVREYIRKALPKHLMVAFELFTPDRTPEIMDAVYKKPFPNRYLASFAPFVAQHLSDPAIFAIAYQSFEEMFTRCICRYEKHKTLPIRFIGSVATHLRPALDKVAADKGVKIDLVVSNPMDGLIRYHMQKITQ